MLRNLIAILTLTPAAVLAGDLHVSVTGDLRCITSDGLPDHSTGRFPNPGNPNRIKEQSVQFCVDATPDYAGSATETRTIGIATNGVIIRPGTADYYDAASRRGHSRNPASGWRLDAVGADLGLDQNLGHADNRGLYHYHGVGDGLSDARGSLIGWAADGFEIHYIGDRATSSYQLKSGTRPTAPGGKYDGTYVEDFEYVKGSGKLDECNGAMVDGTYTYFATDTFPFFPHCLKGARIMRYRG